MPPIIVTKQEVRSPAAVVGSDAEATTLGEPLASSLPAMLKLISPEPVRLSVNGFALALGFVLGFRSAVRCFPPQARTCPRPIAGRIESRS